MYPRQGQCIFIKIAIVNEIEIEKKLTSYVMANTIYLMNVGEITLSLKY